MDITSFFSGCGGMDLGFKKAGFNIVWANEKDQGISDTYEFNHKGTILNKKDIRKIDSATIPSSIGMIGGPPCQSWSSAGKGLGKADPRGTLFFEFIRIVKDKQPLFFVVENVAGMLADRHKESFNTIKNEFESAGYNITIGLLNASDYNVPQDRLRFFFVGYRNDLNKRFEFPRKSTAEPKVKDAIWDLRNSAMGSLSPNKTNGDKCKFPNHEYWQGSYSYIFMSRNRVLDWDKPSYTIQASGRQVSIHPQAPKMKKVEKDVMEFDNRQLDKYRRLTVRECARLQTFPDTFIFKYENLATAYKMIGNAVPVNLAFAIARKIKKDLTEHLSKIKKKKIKSKHGFNTTQERSDLMRKIKSTKTTPEIAFWDELKKLKYDYKVNPPDIIGKPDFVFLKEKIAVFIDGDFWHGYNWKEKKAKLKRNRNYWIMKIENNIKRDKKNNLRLRQKGFKVLRFWENDVKRNPSKCINKLVSHLE